MEIEKTLMLLADFREMRDLGRLKSESILKILERFIGIVGGG